MWFCLVTNEQKSNGKISRKDYRKLLLNEILLLWILKKYAFKPFPHFLDLVIKLPYTTQVWFTSIWLDWNMWINYRMKNISTIKIINKNDELPGSPDKSILELLDDGSMQLVTEILHSAVISLKDYRGLVVRKLKCKKLKI